MAEKKPSSNLICTTFAVPSCGSKSSMIFISYRTKSVTTNDDNNIKRISFHPH
uniref:Uncharacterized protein n=1 Tax=Rhizophora mucronata TaxID=61149 RepID=A0A2P2N2P0_RHIMU